MPSYARCGKCQEITRFHIDRLGRVSEICPVCDEGRKPSTSPELRRAIERMQRTDLRFCAFDECGKDYVPASNRQQYCSESCYKAHLRATGGKAIAAYKASLPKRKCEYDQCRKWFQPNTELQRFCEGRCQKDYKNKQRRLERERDRVLKRAAQRVSLVA